MHSFDTDPISAETSRHSDPSTVAKSMERETNFLSSREELSGIQRDSGSNMDDEIQEASEGGGNQVSPDALASSVEHVFNPNLRLPSLDQSVYVWSAQDPHGSHCHYRTGIPQRSRGIVIPFSFLYKALTW